MNKIILSFCPLVLFAYTIDFDVALEKTLEMNKGLKAIMLQLLQLMQLQQVQMKCKSFFYYLKIIQEK